MVAMMYPPLTSLLSSQSFEAKVVTIKEIGRACGMFGLFNVIDHGISDTLMKESLETNLQFFNMPIEEKRELISTDIHLPVRFRTVVEEKGNGKFRSDFLKLYANPLEDFIVLWRQNPPDYRRKMGAYAKEVWRLGIGIFVAIMDSLNIVDTTIIQEKINQGMQIMAVNRYHTGPEGNIPTGIEPHMDHSLITLLLQSSPGLYIMDSDQEGAWKIVPRPEGSLQVIVGDHLEVLSDGIYKSVMHQAAPSPTDDSRFSFVSLLSFAMNEATEPAMELVDEEHPGQYKGSSLSRFLERLASKDAAPYIQSLKIRP